MKELNRLLKSSVSVKTISGATKNGISHHLKGCLTDCSHKIILCHGTNEWLMSVLCNVLPLQYHFKSNLLTFISGVCCGIPCSSVSCYVETSYLIFMTIQLIDCHVMWDLGVGNCETDSEQFFSCLTFTLLSCSSFEGIFWLRVSR